MRQYFFEKFKSVEFVIAKRFLLRNEEVLQRLGLNLDYENCIPAEKKRKTAVCKTISKKLFRFVYEDRRTRLCDKLFIYNYSTMRKVYSP